MSEKAPRARWTPTAKLLVSAALVALSIFLISRFSGLIPALVLAMVLAYVLAPLVSRVQRWLRIPRGLATLLVYILLLALVALVPILLAPTLVDQLSRLGDNLQSMILTLEDFLGEEISFGGFVVNGAQVVEQIATTLRGALEPLFGQTVTILVNVISSFVSGAFVLVISFYMIKDSTRLGQWAERLSPEPYREDFRRLKSEINAIWSAFFRGQLVLALVVAGIFTVAGLILGIPFFLAMAVLAGLLEFVPSIGHGIWLTLASLLVLFQGSTWIPLQNWIVMLIVIGLHVIFMQVDLNILIPRIIGRRVHLHPLVVILGILAGAALAGVLGVVLAAPTIATSRVLGRYLMAGLFDLDPFPEDDDVEHKDEPGEKT
ncbi:MAG: AI-2E family transporter [Anaerolineales bacterium]|jgi:predicted PurR-regulated permease PerM